MVAHFQQAAGPVVPHAGKQNAYRVATGGCRDRFEQQVDARAVAIHEILVRVACPPAILTTCDGQVRVTAGEDCPSRRQGVVVARLRNLHRAASIQATGEAGREVRGHVLHDDDGWMVFRRSRQEGTNRLSAAGGRAYGNQVSAWDQPAK